MYTVHVRVAAAIRVGRGRPRPLLLRLLVLYIQEQWTARVAFGYSPLFGCFLLTSPPVLLEKGTVAC